MASEKTILRAEQGVTLTEVTLRSGSAVVNTAYVVKSRRTPEVRNFNNLAAAEAGFREEVARCAKTNL